MVLVEGIDEYQKVLVFTVKNPIQFKEENNNLWTYVENSNGLEDKAIMMNRQKTFETQLRLVFTSMERGIARQDYRCETLDWSATKRLTKGPGAPLRLSGQTYSHPDDAAKTVLRIPIHVNQNAYRDTSTQAIFLTHQNLDLAPLEEIARFFRPSSENPPQAYQR